MRSLRSRAQVPKSSGTPIHHLRAEQELGRVGASIDPEVVGSLLVSSSFFCSFTQLLTAQTLPGLKGPGLIRHLLR